MYVLGPPYSLLEHFQHLSIFCSCTLYVGVVVDEVVLGQTILRACSLFCDFTQRRLVFYYRRFGATYRSHRQESRVRDCLALEALSLVLPDDDQRGSTKESPVVEFWKSTTGDTFCWPTVLERINCTLWRFFLSSLRWHLVLLRLTSHFTLT